MLAIEKNDNHYLERFDTEFKNIFPNTISVTHNRQCKSFTSTNLSKRLENIKIITNRASRMRYMASQEPEVILATLINQILEEINGVEKENEFFAELSSTPKDVTLDNILVGFEFYDNNPFRIEAEKRLEKLRRKRGW